jgi:hypothetical protein
VTHYRTIRVIGITNSDKQRTPLKESEPVSTKKYYYDQDISDVARKGGRLDLVKIPLYISNADGEPPQHPGQGTHLTQGVSEGAWKANVIGCTEGCTKCGELAADLNKIPKDRLDTKMGPDGEWYYKIPFTLKATFRAATISFDLVHERKEDGRVKMETYASVGVNYL